MDLNEAATLGSMNIGIGCTQVREYLASMNINGMSEVVYKKNQDIILEYLKEACYKSMQEAGLKETEIAIKAEQLHKGKPWIKVIVNGSWMTRSYGNKFKSLSGLAVMIGYNTELVLFIGTRNKCCTTCDRAQLPKTIPKPHKCYKNYDSSALSGAMESDIIMERFKRRVMDNNLIYKIFISDNDSSIYKSIVDNAD